MAVLQIENIRKNYRRNAVLRGVSFEARDGDCIGISRRGLTLLSPVCRDPAIGV